MPTQEIECKRITIPKGYPERQPFSRLFAEILASSIQHYGLLQPIIVRPGAAKYGRFLLIAGRYRLYAVANILKERCIEAKVVEGLSQTEAGIMFFLENTERLALSSAESNAVKDQLWHEIWFRAVKDVKLGEDVFTRRRVTPTAHARRARALAHGFMHGGPMTLAQHGVSVADALRIAQTGSQDDRRRIVNLIAGGKSVDEAIDKVIGGENKSRPDNETQE